MLCFPRNPYVSLYPYINLCVIFVLDKSFGVDVWTKQNGEALRQLPHYIPRKDSMIMMNNDNAVFCVASCRLTVV